MDSEKLEILINKFFLKELTSEEKIEFEDHLKSSNQAREIFRQWCFINRSIDALQFDKATTIIPFDILPQKTRFSVWKSQALKYVAILAIPILIGLSYWLADNHKTSQEIVKELTCENNANHSILITLPDSSKVRLYAHSVLKYPDVFVGDERHVKLIGEATFEVVSNPQNPFYVEAIDGSTVKAYGTKFNVSGYENDEVIQVYLERGKVNFSSPNLTSPKEMEPATKLEFNIKNNELNIYPVDGAEYRAYEEGVLLFRSKSLEYIARKLSRVYNIDIEIENNEVQNYLITASFKDKSITQIMNVLKLSTPGLEWKAENNKIILFK
jgi:transmembrane sensor